MSSPSRSPGHGKGKGGHGKGKGKPRALTAAEKHKRAGGGFLNEVKLVCSSEARARELEEAFEADGNRVESVYATDNTVVVEFKSLRKAIESLDHVLGLNLPKVQARNPKPPHGHKLIKTTHLMKFVKDDVPKADGVVSASLDTHNAAAPPTGNRGGRGQATRPPKVTWVLHCDGIEPQRWTSAAKIVPSILFGKVLGNTEEAKAIRHTLKELVKIHLDEKRRGNKEYNEKNVKAYYAAKNHDNIRLVLTRLLRAGVCHLFEDPKGHELNGNEIRAKGKGPRSTSVGAGKGKSKENAGTVGKGKGRPVGKGKGKAGTFGKGKAGPVGKGKGIRTRPSCSRSFGKGKGRPVGKGKTAALLLARANIYNHYLKPSVRTQVDEMEREEHDKFLDKLVTLERNVRLLDDKDAREELKEYFISESLPSPSGNDGDDTKPMKKRAEDAFALGFALCEAGVAAKDINDETLKRHLKGNKKLRKALGLERIRQQIRRYSRSLSK